MRTDTIMTDSIPTIITLVHPDVLDYVKSRFGYTDDDLIIDSLDAA